MLHSTRFRSATAVLAVTLGAGPAAGAQAPSRQTVVAGRDYKAGGFTRLWLGDDYRELWATPVSVEVLDLGKEAGGLKPVRRVGGQQTKGLALAGADGRSYTFRGLDKDASHLLDAVDPELKDTVVAKMLDLLMAAQHPASELDRARDPRRGRHPLPGLAARRAARRPRARRVPEGLRGCDRRVRGVPDAGQGRRARVHRRDRDHRPRGALQAAAGGQRRRDRRPGAAEGAPRGHLHGRLGPPPQAVALGEGARQPAVGADPRGPRPGVLALRGARPRHAPAAPTRASRTSGRSTRASAGSPTTARSRTASCWCRSRGRTSSPPRRRSRRS